MRLAAFAVSLVFLAVPAAAQHMNAEDFHRRATSLKAKGPLALLHKSEIDALMREGEAAGQAARTQRMADEQAGRPARYCPPPGKVSMDSGSFLKKLSGIPPVERRRIDMTEATVRILAQTYPCRG